MPRVTIRRHPHFVSPEEVKEIAQAMPPIVADVLKVKPEEVEVLVVDFGPFDINVPPLGIDILTGTGKDNDWRLRQRGELSLAIEERVRETGLIKQEWIDKRSYVWLLPTGSSFVPIGSPDLKR